MINIEELYKTHAETVYRFLYSHVNDVDLCEELTQETFLRAVKSIKNYNGKCKISVWLCQIAKHVLYKEFERKKRIRTTNLSEDIKDNVYSIEELMVFSESKKNIYKSIQSLDGLSKEVMYLRLTGELSFKEIGEILNKTENWARVTFYRSKSKIVRRMNNE